MVSSADPASDRELKAKHRALWASGDYPAVAAELIPELGPELVRAAGIKPGDRVLDVAAGSGNAAIPAAEAGATVTASDLTPELFDAGRSIAAQRGVDLEWVEADAEALPFADSSFDAVISCVGVMFAPHHQAAADELVRVVRPGYSFFAQSGARHEQAFTWSRRRIRRQETRRRLLQHRGDLSSALVAARALRRVPLRGGSSTPAPASCI